MRKRSRLLLALTLLLLGGFFVVPKWWASVRESALHSRIKHELLDEFPELASEDWRVYLDGRQGVIHGTVSSQSLYTEVDELLQQLGADGAKSIRGLDSLECALTVPHRSSLDLSIDDDTGAIQISGEVPADAVGAISTALTSAFPEAAIEEDIHISSGRVATAPWAVALGEIAPTLVRSIGNLSIKLEGRAITINGCVASEKSRIEIQRMLLERFSGSIDYVRNGLTTLETELETSFLTVQFSNADTIVLGGRIESKSTHDQLVRGIEAIAPAGFLVEDRIKIRPAASGSWWTRPTLAFLPKAFESLQGSEFRVDATGVHISDMQATTEEQGSIATLAKNYFPAEIYAYASDLNSDYSPEPTVEPGEKDTIASAEPPPPTPAETNPAPEVPDETSPPEPDPTDTAGIEKLIAETQVFFSSGSTRVREPEREKITALAEQLSNAPELKIDISGLADPVGNAAANRRLAQRRCTAVLIALEESGIDPSRLQIIGGGEKSPQPGEATWKLRRVEFAIHQPKIGNALATASGSPDPISETQIYFEKSSTRLSREERGKLDRVAAVLKGDSEGVLALAGFTDPRGNRYYNERLSKLRCQAVQDYLIGKGVPTTRLKTQPGGELSSAASGEPSWKLRRVEFRWVELAASR